MNFDDNECTVTISRARYAELVVAEQDAKRLKEIIADKCEHFVGITLEELRILRDLFMLKEENEC